MSAVYGRKGEIGYVDLRGLRTDLDLSIIQLNLQMRAVIGCGIGYLLDVLHVAKR